MVSVVSNQDISHKRQIVTQHISEILADIYSPQFFAKTRHIYKILRPYNEYFSFSQRLLLGFVDVPEIHSVATTFNDDIIYKCFEYASNAYKLYALIDSIKILRSISDGDAEKTVFTSELKKYNISHKCLNSCSMAQLQTQVRDLSFSSQVELYDIIYQLLS
jgi:hypothetical protein